MDKHSPTPWRVSHGYIVLDADGVSIAHAVRCPDAALIVEAVNAVDATLKLQRTLLGWSMERDRLRDLVGRMIPGVETALALSEAEGEALDRWLALNREAREALGEEAAAEAVTQAVKAIDPHALPPFHEEYAIKTTQGYVWTGETVEERRLFKTREGAEELKARMEAEDAKYMACAHPKRTIVRRVVGEWEDA